MSDPRYSRADFFRVSLRSTVEALSEVYTQAQRIWTAPLEPPPPSPPRPSFVRPPGAGAEADFLAACTSCNDCILACPHQVIRKAGPELGAQVSGTPIILPSLNPCLMCEDFPCVAACEPAALKLESGTAIGLAVANPAVCYSSADKQDCNYCRGPCPERPRAIRVPGRGELPVVEAETCTGCGKCAVICPAEAITIQPLQRT